MKIFSFYISLRYSVQLCYLSSVFVLFVHEAENIDMHVIVIKWCIFTYISYELRCNRFHEQMGMCFSKDISRLTLRFRREFTRQ